MTITGIVSVLTMTVGILTINFLGMQHPHGLALLFGCHGAGTPQLIITIVMMEVSITA